MLSKTSLILSSLLSTFALAQQETVYGVYIFHRHGDRTPKSLPPTNLTTLGYEQVVTSGTYYRNRYVSGSAALKVQGLSSDIVRTSQITVTAPADTVLQNSATGFLQGLYPPVATTETLANGNTVTRPFGGYQLIPVGLVSAGTGSEDNGWLQDASGCANAATSSARYFSSDEFNTLYNSTTGFYDRLVPVVNETFAANTVNFRNAYTVYDLINVAAIHNSSIPSGNLLDNSTLLQVRTLADTHEFGLAYNASDNARAVPGMQLAGEVIKYLNGTINTAGKQKLGIQFGAYATALSFFGLADLPKANPDFYGIPDYASSMVFELFSSTAGNTSSSTASFPAARDLQVRFLFHNGSASATSEPVAYPLFGGSDVAIPWTTFLSKMNAFAVSTTQQWCHTCGNTTGICAPSANGASSSNADGSSNGGNNGSGISAAVGGVIGAFVTLAVILAAEALIMLVGGFRLARKGAIAAPSKA